MPYSGIDERTRKRPASSDRSSGSIWQRFDAPLKVHLSPFRICESLSLALTKFSRFCEISNARMHKLFLQNYNIESNSALKYFTRVGDGSPATRDSIISLLFIIRIIVLLINRAFYCMRLPYPRLSSDIIISRFIFDIARITRERAVASRGPDIRLNARDLYVCW